MPNAMGAILGFLTIFPASNHRIEDAARHAYMFPVAGSIIGLVAGLVGAGAAELVDGMLAAFVTVALLYVITGMHHADGLADLADGLMTNGDAKRKLGAMKDAATGSAGVAATVLCVAGLVAAVSSLDYTGMLAGIILAEILAKFSMVTAAYLGRPAAGTGGTMGTGALFMRHMNGKKFLAAAGMTAVPVIVIGGINGAFMAVAAVATTLAILGISRRSFGGINGDVMGGINELARLASLVVFVI